MSMSQPHATSSGGGGGGGAGGGLGGLGGGLGGVGGGLVGGGGATTTVMVMARVVGGVRPDTAVTPRVVESPLAGSVDSCVAAAVVAEIAAALEPAPPVSGSVAVTCTPTDAETMLTSRVQVGGKHASAVASLLSRLVSAAEPDTKSDTVPAAVNSTWIVVAWTTLRLIPAVRGEKGAGAGGGCAGDGADGIAAGGVAGIGGADGLPGGVAGAGGADGPAGGVAGAGGLDGAAGGAAGDDGLGGDDGCDGDAGGHEHQDAV